MHTAVAWSVAGIAILFALMRSGSPPPAPARVESTIDDLGMTMERIASSLERIEQRLSGPRPDVPARDIAAAPGDAAPPGVEVFRVAVREELQGALNAVAPVSARDASLERARENARPTDQSALARLFERHAQIGDAARQELMILSPAQVLGRYGMPSDVGTGQGGGSIWRYVSADGAQYLRLTFLDGYVSRVNIN